MNSAASRGASIPTPDEFKSLLGEAITLKNQERYREAVHLLERLRETNPESASVHALLGDALWEENDLAGATACFRKAVELAPSSEMASLGLFHTLLELGDKSGAILQMTRFQKVAPSEEYARIALRLSAQPGS